jgi:hypothetical protein
MATSINCHHDLISTSIQFGVQFLERMRADLFFSKKIDGAPRVIDLGAGIK